MEREMNIATVRFFQYCFNIETFGIAFIYLWLLQYFC